MARAAEAGLVSVVLACEPTGRRWRVLDQSAAGLGVRLVCVQPLLVARAREAEDFTRNKNDDADAMIIARPVTELRCYLSERADPAWARLRHLGARRARLITDLSAARQQIRDLLECAWPAALDAASTPLDSASWQAALGVVSDYIGAIGELDMIGRWAWDAFAAAVRRELGATRWYSAIVRAVFTAATDPGQAGTGVASRGPTSDLEVHAATECQVECRQDQVAAQRVVLMQAKGATTECRWWPAEVRDSAYDSVRV